MYKRTSWVQETQHKYLKLFGIVLVNYENVAMDHLYNRMPHSKSGNTDYSILKIVADFK
jgi:hypothetical protein